MDNRPQNGAAPYVNGQAPPTHSPPTGRMIRQILLWLPTLFLLGILLILDRSLFKPFTESYTGLRLTVADINPEIVFQPAFERANFTNPLDRSIWLKDTELKPVYELDQYGHFLRFQLEHEPSASQNNISNTSEPTSHYIDFPRLLLSTESPTLLKGQIPVEGPDDVIIPTISQEIINEPFEKALVWKNEERARVVKYDIIMTVIICLAFLISVICGVCGIFLLVPLLWSIKAFHEYSPESTSISEALENEVVCQIFRNNYRAWGLELQVIHLEQPGFDPDGVIAVTVLGWLVSFIAANAEVELYNLR